MWAKKNSFAMLESLIDLAPSFQKRNVLLEKKLRLACKWYANQFSEQWGSTRRFLVTSCSQSSFSELNRTQ